MTRRNGLWFAAAVVATASVMLLLRRPDVGPAPPDPVIPDTAPALAAPAIPPMQATVVTALTPEDHAFLSQLRAKFTPHLADKHAQVKAIEQLVAYLMQRYPQDWRERIRGFLDLLFPDLAAELFARFEALQRLNAWLGEHREELLRLSPSERRARLWAARREAFGADADEIFAAEVRNERINASLQALDVAQGLTTPEKLARYLEAVREVYGEQAEDFIASRQTELLNRFLDVPSVQAELREMTPEQRSQSLRDTRAGMGMEPAALARWDQLDQQRDSSWQAGQQYHREREALLARPADANRERELAALRERSFGPEAEVIAAEEAAGFYRYGQPRRYGRE